MKLTMSYARAFGMGLAILALGSLRADSVPDQGAADDDSPATVLEVSGQVQCIDEDHEAKAVELGQILDEGDRITSAGGSSVQLLLADGSSMALGPESDFTLTKVGKGEAGSQSFFELLKGSVNAIVHKLQPGSTFEVKGPGAVAAVKGTQFEMAGSGAESDVTVHEGDVAMSDSDRKNTVHVLAMQKAGWHGGRLGAAKVLDKSERKAFVARWAHARQLHARRENILKRMGSKRAAMREAFRQRRQRRQRRQHRKAGPGAAARPQAQATPVPGHEAKRKHLQKRRLKKRPLA